MAGNYILLISLYLRYAASAGPTSSLPCCLQKIVGGISYTLVQESDTNTFNCLTNCVYQETGNPGQLFCFSAGDLEVECVSGGNCGYNPVVFAENIGDFITRENVTDITFQAHNVLTNQLDHYNLSTAIANYWLAPEARNSILFYDIGCSINIHTFFIVNTHNAGFNDRGTKDFNISVRNTQTDPWINVVNGSLKDARWKTIPPIQIFDIQISQFSISARYVMFKIASFFGSGGGLQYFSPN